MEEAVVTFRVVVDVAVRVVVRIVVVTVAVSVGLLLIGGSGGGCRCRCYRGGVVWRCSVRLRWRQRLWLHRRRPLLIGLVFSSFLGMFS